MILHQKRGGTLYRSLRRTYTTPELIYDYFDLDFIRRCS